MQRMEHGKMSRLSPIGVDKLPRRPRYHMLATHRVEKPWGRHDLLPLFPDQPAELAPIGEIWFGDAADKHRELLIKYLFTSERLSVQVHPDDQAARARGFERGKDEAWIVLSAEPGATIALGFKTQMDPSAVRRGAQDGSIEDMLVWRPVKAGDVIYAKAGTVHAIGKGLRVVEIQQNLDLTYRFYDYGSPRELHLDDAMAVSDLGPFSDQAAPRTVEAGRQILAENAKFVLEQWTMPEDLILTPRGTPIWLLPIEGHIRVDGERVTIAEALVVEGTVDVSIEPGATLYAAYPGARVIDQLISGRS